jgi:hypothetical protein
MPDKGNQVTTGGKSKTLMWKFQWLFAPQVADKAQRVFNKLDNKLNPRVFLIGMARQFHDEQQAKLVFGRGGRTLIPAAFR